MTLENGGVIDNYITSFHRLFSRLAPLLASAAVEKLLGLIMSHNGTQLTDKHFENLVFLKANQWQAD